MDLLAKKYSFQSPYAFATNNPVRLVDVDGLGVETDFINIETGKRTHLEDGKDQVMAMTSSGMDHLQNLYDTDCDAYNSTVSELEGKNVNLHLTTSEFDDITGTVYAEASTDGEWKESAAIYSVLRNRAKAQGNEVINQITSGVAGYSSREKYRTSTEINLKNSAQKGVARAIVSDTNYSNGAYFWAGTDIATNSNEKRQTGGLLFTDSSHDVMNVGSLKITGAPITKYWKDKDGNDTRNARGTYNYTYESTAGFGKTTFMKYTQKFINAAGNKTYP